MTDRRAFVNQELVLLRRKLRCCDEVRTAGATKSTTTWRAGHWRIRERQQTLLIESATLRFKVRLNFAQRLRQNNLAFQLTFEARHIGFVFRVKVNDIRSDWPIRSR